MTTAVELDMVGVLSPVCLLKCKSVLRGLRAGQIVDIVLQDPEVVEALVTIVERSEDAVVCRDREGDCFRIKIRKGGSADKGGNKGDAP